MTYSDGDQGGVATFVWNQQPRSGAVQEFQDPREVNAQLRFEVYKVSIARSS